MSEHRTYWAAREKPADAVALPLQPGDLTADVLVVGGGITGLTAALLLAEAGRNVVVVELRSINDGTTGHSTGHLDFTSDETLHKLAGSFGDEALRVVTGAKRAAIDHVFQRDRALQLGADVVRVPAYLYAEDADGVPTVEQEYETALRLGLPARLLDAAPLPFATMRAVEYPDQARCDPLRYVRGLARAFEARGGRILEYTRAESTEERDGSVVVETNRGTITGRAALLAGHAPLIGMVSVETRARPYQSYVLAARVANETPDALYWDTATPYHYTRHAASGEPGVLIVGGADHPTGRKPDTRACYQELEDYARRHYRVAAVTHRWSGEWFEPADGLPYVGRAPGHAHVYVAAAYSGDGLTFGTLAGALLADLALGRPNPLAEILAPTRLKPLASAGRVAATLVRATRHLVGDRLARGEAASAAEIAPGGGALVVQDGERCAVHRDANGELHYLSPVCTHMKCIVHWNTAEQTWDCPCHGGRYDALGHVIYGPPKQDLKPLAEHVPAR